MAEELQYIISLRGGAEAAAQARALKDAISGVGGSMNTVGKESGKAAGGVNTLQGSLRRTALALGAVGAGYAAWNQAKKAIDFTKELTTNTMTLSKATGMSTGETSRLLGVTSAMGESQSALGVAVAKLSTQVKTEIANKGKAASATGKHSLAVQQLNERQELAYKLGQSHVAGMTNQAKATVYMTKLQLKQNLAMKQALAKQGAGSKGKGPLEELGVSTSFLASHSKDFGAILGEVIKRVGELPKGMNEASNMTKVFGRGWQSLSPLLLGGIDHLKKMTAMAKLYGVELSGDPLKAQQKFVEQQEEWKLATEGLQIQFTKFAMGPLGEVLKGFSALALAMHTGDWRAFDEQANKLAVTFSKVAEKVVPKLAETFAHMAPILLKALWRGFESASLPGEAVVAYVLLAKMGLTSMLFRGVGAKLGGSMAAGMGEETAAFAVAGGALGAAAALALGAALVIGGAKAIHGLVEALSPGYLKSHSLKEAQAVLETGGTHSVAELKAKAGYQGHVEAGGRGKNAWGARHEAAGGKAARGSNAGRTWTDPTSGRTYYWHQGEHPFGVPAKIANASDTMAKLAPGSLADNRDIVIKVDAKELARVNRRQALESMAAGS